MASAHSSARTSASPVGGEVALVEDEVDDGEHRPQPVGQLGVDGHAVGDVGGPDLVLGPHEPLGHRRLGDEEGPGDLGGLQPGDQPQRQRHLGAGGQGGVAAGEDQAELVVGHGPTSVGSSSGACRRTASAWRSSRVDSRRMRSIARLRAVVMIQPAGLGGSPVSGQRCEGDHEGVLDRLLGEVDVAEEADQGGHRSSRLGAEDPLDVGRAGRRMPGQSLGLVLEGPDLDRAPQAALPSAAQLQGGVEVGGLDDPEAAELLLGLGEGAVGGEDLAALVASTTVAVSAGCRPPANTQAPCVLELGVEGVDGGEHLLHLVLGGIVLALDHVHGEQVLRHVGSSWFGARPRRRLTLYTNAIRPIDTSAEIFA